LRAAAAGGSVVVSVGYTSAMARRGGIDLGGTKVQAAIVDDDGQVRGESRHPTPTTGGPQAVADTCAAALREAADASGVKTRHLEAVGVGSPGVIDVEAGSVTSARNLPDWEGTFPLGESLSGALGTPVVIGNDVDVATLAEFELGAGKPYDSLLGVFWGTGVGGGLILEGRRWAGRGAAGEIGHMVVQQSGGARCSCGRLGCMEAYAGRGALEAIARRRAGNGEPTILFDIMEERGRTRLTSGVWNRALKHDDQLAQELIDQAVEALGTAIGSAVNLIDPEAVIIGGGLGLKLGQPYVDRIVEAMMPHVFADERPPAVHLASLGDLGGAIGAALLAREAATSAPRA
jgi:glucokinase